MPQRSGLSIFNSQIKRRRLFRAAAFYGGIAFVIMQIIVGVFDYLHIPDLFGTTTTVRLLVGIPVVMFLTRVDTQENNFNAGSEMASSKITNILSNFS